MARQQVSPRQCEVQVEGVGILICTLIRKLRTRGRMEASTTVFSSAMSKALIFTKTPHKNHLPSVFRVRSGVPCAHILGPYCQNNTLHFLKPRSPENKIRGPSRGNPLNELCSISILPDMSSASRDMKTEITASSLNAQRHVAANAGS